MKRAIGYVLFHCSEACSSARRMFCEKEGAWCKFHQSKNEGKEYVEKAGIPLVVKDVIAPILSDLSKNELLAKCLNGKTQSNNEAINVIIWKKLPKDVFVGRNVLGTDISSAIINFNDGACGFLKVMENLNLQSGFFTTRYCNKHDIAGYCRLVMHQDNKHDIAG